MAGSFVSVDLSKLPLPNAVQQIDFEVIFAEMLADLRARDTAFTALVESDPAYKVLEVAAWREMLLRQKANEDIRAVMLAFALGSDLDQIAARYNVLRLVLDPGDANAVPPVPPTLEPDEDLRRRVQLAFEGLSVAGPEGAYIFHALGASPEVLDASVSSPTPGNVAVTVLSRIGAGGASGPLLATVLAALNAKSVRPLTDNVTVQSATIVPFTVTAVLTLFAGPDSAVVLSDAQQRVNNYVWASRGLGRDITRAGLIAALFTEGVQNVNLSSPVADVVINSGQVANPDAVTVTVGGVGG